MLTIGILAALGVTAVCAQDLRLDAPPPVREPGAPAPESRSTEPSFYDPGPGSIVPYDPAFIRPFVKDTETGRMGLSVWTAPNPHLGLPGTGEREHNGWLGLGFTRTWGGPPTPLSRP